MESAVFFAIWYFIDLHHLPFTIKCLPLQRINKKIMKKIFLFLAIASLAITSCRKDDDNTDTTETVSIETQNSYDDAAITQFLKDNYLFG